MFSTPTIASNVSGTSYIDTDVVNGTTYYYVITAITVYGESDNSNEASAMPVAAPVETGEAILRVTRLTRANVNTSCLWPISTVLLIGLIGLLVRVL